jgi:predicted RecB family nuclease
MRMCPSSLELSATDLSQFLGCRHRTALDLAVAQGRRKAPQWRDPVAEILQQRGLDHEYRYTQALAAQGLAIANLQEHSGEDAAARALEAMREGVDVLFQPALRDGRWFGRPDVLRRIETPSAFGAWSYEVFDTKLAKDTRGGTILQLALYSDLLGNAQGFIPESFYVVTPDPKTPVHTYRLQEYSAYFRLVRARLESTTQRDSDVIAAENYPEPVEHCAVCRWWSNCDKRRRADDHLSLVAGMARLQSRELQVAGVTTVAELAGLPLPLQLTPRRGAVETYIRVREQARVQVAGRLAGKPIHELLPIVPGQGLARLPSPSPGDVFLDLEGDPFARDGGREYLFGWIVVGPDLRAVCASRSLWAWTDTEERAAFEALIDEIQDLWSANPGMHVYHYHHYEPSAMKRLMGRYATRESEVDRLLRAERFVDLHAVVRHSIRASVESYSIKDLEPFYSFARHVALSDARINLRLIEGALELNAAAEVTEEARAAVAGYNQDDCLSALALRGWLEELRIIAESGGAAIPRPELKEGTASEKVDERVRRTQTLMSALISGLSPERSQRSDEEQARWLLAHLLDWHRRESKAPWFEFFRLRDLADGELIDEKAAVAGLTLVGRVGGTPRNPVDRYSYPTQETDVRDGDALHLPDGTQIGTVDAIDRIARTLDMKKAGKQADVHPLAVFAHSVVRTEVLADALFRIGQDVLDNGVDGKGQYQVARQLLLARAPRLKGDSFQQQIDETAVQFATRIVSSLDNTVLAIQGPPGAGKTQTGSQMICDLVRRGAKVGITAVSHKVIRNLLSTVVQAGGEIGHTVKCVHKVTTKGDTASAIEEVTDNADAIERLRSGRAHVVGGTPWLWASPTSRGTVDVLFVDEAGQMSLANVLAASQAAKSVVLLGDPQQLEQPQQGSHPEGTDVSALDHILQGGKTIPANRGIFLPETWRLPPSICTFTSEAFYEGRLRSKPGLERQVLSGTAPFEGSGLWVVPVLHDGNQNTSKEEAETVSRIAAILLRGQARWTDWQGVSRPVTPEDILVVAPYNSHVALLTEGLGSLGIRIGTVDKFQGQQAPIVIYSMATSCPEDAPRGMEFLYSLNRLNVATSRARCVCILVANPRLFEPECKSPRQMQLANALCRYVELSTVHDGIL